MFTAREIAKELNEDAATVRAVLSSIDQGAIFAAAKAKVVVELWDGSSDIQGIPAAHWTSSGELPAGGRMYLLRDVASGLVLRAQPHAPGGIGRAPMTEQQALAFGEADRDQIAANLARAEIIKAVDLALDAQA
jgi:hypothetical protein